MNDASVNLRLDIAYDGTNFHGWALQAGDLRTVQGVIEDKLRLVLQLPVNYHLTVAGRTDAGVHATGQVAAIEVPTDRLEQRSIAGDPSTLTRRLNKLLPPDIQIRAVQAVPAEFDARFCAVSRAYIYRVTCAVEGVSPLRRWNTAVWPKPVNLAVAHEAAHRLLGLHDFAAFCRPRPCATTVRELLQFDWVDVSSREEPDTFEAHVRADAFCWNMVRSLVGATLAAGAGTRSVDFVAGLLSETSRSDRIPVAPAHGLTLVDVEYPPPEEWAARAEVTRNRRGVAEG
ncbi:MAG: tRNA pseudouridine(38-40) synthase TruA [Corynebacterium sp.]|nr:tRNA pseudouridine(38-40) synthase TruA [Corynebacterium sp.]